MPISLPQIFPIRNRLRHSDYISAAARNRSVGRTDLAGSKRGREHVIPEQEKGYG
jgi:hypothetical protein